MVASRVIVNDYKGAYSAVAHLILNGYRMIAHISGPSNLRLSQNRLKGYLDALKAHRLPEHDDKSHHPSILHQETAAG